MEDMSKFTVDPATKLILVVEDDSGIRELLEFAIKKEGFRVVTACDGSEGLQKIQSDNPDLVFLDLMLPNKGGFDVLRELQGSGTRVPIVVVTGRYTDKSNEAMIRQEANVLAFMQKPVRPAALAVFLHTHFKTMAPELKRRQQQGLS